MLTPGATASFTRRVIHLEPSQRVALMLPMGQRLFSVKIITLWNCDLREAGDSSMQYLLGPVEWT